MCNRKLNKNLNKRRRGKCITVIIAVMLLFVMMCDMSAFALVDDQDKPDAGNANGIITYGVEGKTENPDVYLKPTGAREVNNIPGSTYTIQVTENGTTYTIGYVVRSAKILPEEISGMDSDQALEYIANKSMTFYTDRNATVIPDIVFGRDYFVRVNGLTHVTPDTLRGSYKLEIANNSGFNNAATTTVTIGNSGNGGNGGSGGNTNTGNVDRTNTNGHSTATNVVQSLARRISSGTRVRGANRAPSAARAHQVNQNAISDSSNASAANSANNSSESSRSSAGAEGRGSGSAGNGIASSRTVETVANAATAGAGAGSAWLAVLIISDIKLLLWYKKLKEAKRKSAL